MNISKLSKYKVLIIDCDGVLTDNCIYYDNNKCEFMKFNKDDSLAINIIKKINKDNKLFQDFFILSKDRNKIIEKRAKILKIKFFLGVNDKLNYVNQYALKNNIQFSNIIYIGNSLNDFRVMEKVGLSVCPKDALKKIRDISKIKLNKNGGEGVLLEFLTSIIDFKLLREYI